MITAFSSAWMVGDERWTTSLPKGYGALSSMKKSISEIINVSLKDDRALIITSSSITMRGLTSLSIIRPRRRSTFKKRHDQEEKKDVIPLFRNE